MTTNDPYSAERVRAWAALQYPSGTPLDQDRRMVAAETEAYLSGRTGRETSELSQAAKYAGPVDPPAARIIDEHRATGRWVGAGVRVECACGHASQGDHPGGPQTSEDNAHRDADRKHAAHVADMLARSTRRDEEKRDG